MPRIRFDLAQQGITPKRWELGALARGATVTYHGQKFTYPVADGGRGLLVYLNGGNCEKNL
jgi:large subunit ribosomal protein L30